MITVESNALINVPSTIAICPYCNGKLSLTCHAWVQEDDRTWSADEIDMDCDTEPDNYRSPEYRIWLSIHTNMPYVYWMPVEERVKGWLNDNYRFDLSGDSLLKQWNEGIADWAHL